MFRLQRFDVDNVDIFCYYSLDGGALREHGLLDLFVGQEGGRFDAETFGKACGRFMGSRVRLTGRPALRVLRGLPDLRGLLGVQVRPASSLRSRLRPLDVCVGHFGKRRLDGWTSLTVYICVCVV